MNLIKEIVKKTTGYWLHKLDTLPVGADLFWDIQKKLNYSRLDVLFDVGANVGQTRYWFRYYNPQAKIYCFEPVKATFATLQQNGKADQNCVFENLALGDVRGTKVIRLFEANLGVLNSLDDKLMNSDIAAREECINVEGIDEYCQAKNIAKVDLLKIDTEGYDINVLKGAERMLADGAIPLIYCETGFQSCNQRNTYFPTLVEFLEARNYYFFGLYQMDYHDWERGNHLGNALFVHKGAFRR
jgi:FkbM family methyltransferase